MNLTPSALEAKFWLLSGPREGCLGAGSGCRSENRAHPGPEAGPEGESKLNHHTRVHCGLSTRPWVCQPFRLPENVFLLATPRTACPWPRRWLATPPASLTQWRFWGLVAQSAGTSPLVTHRVPKGWGNEHTRARFRIRTLHFIAMFSNKEGGKRVWTREGSSCLLIKP